MSSSFDLPELDLFTAGTEGDPGSRVFFLQALSDRAVVTLRLEKTQVAALAQYLAELLTDLPTPLPAELPSALDPVPPLVPEWIVGQIGVAFDETRDRMLLRLDELVVDDDDVPPPEDPGSARFALTRAQVAGFIARAFELVNAGRPPCPLCNRPLDPAGHMCIKTNGHRARAR